MQLTDEQTALGATVVDFATTHLAPHAVRWDRDRHFPVDVLRKAATLGLGGVYVDERHGGSGLGRLDGVIVFEALATGCPSLAAYTSIHNMVAAMIDRYGTPAQQATHLPRLCTMETLGAYCLTEPHAGSDAAAIGTKARRSSDGWMLDGVKQFISGAGAAGLYVVFARTGAPGPKGVSAFLVDADTPGLTFGPNEAKMGWNAQPTRQVILDQVRLPATALLGHENSGFAIAMAALDGGRLNIGACSLGGAQYALDRATAHLRDRPAFGAPLAQAQALRFRVADALTHLTAARLLLHQAADELDRGDPDASTRCAMAKRLATDTGFDVANTALQLHGGYGYLTETGIEKIVRDLRVHQILEGTNEIMRLIIARSLLDERRAA
ncbi:acyl-CoA dehydrogenase [Verrucosispora sp. SN26_14.1]|uniref:acyl-CoA dehydrogenase family protein n=1 Tax=Verrucosispora sp. SN26_14.1 TaxID=2527879 RepID=UPI001033C314|nr:acyl-CoA dehydrogenase family protein [Verrucosispora sp. SN26_14.1]TBL40660.1 acyl-CoA dehydrogenase [Verrucosispora sp. SN26_14.1]